MNSRELIIFKNVSIGYRTAILENINLSIYEGDKILLLGANGTGKTTLLKTITKLIAPLSGKIEFFYHSISYVPQTKTLPIFPLKIYDVLRLYYPFFYPEQKKMQEIESALKQMNLWEKRNSLITECSGGEIQRMYIARAILLKPQILVLDEPLNAVDIQNREYFFNILQQLYEELKCAIIMTGHNLDNKIIRFFDRKLYLVDKNITEEVYV